MPVPIDHVMLARIHAAPKYDFLSIDEEVCRRKFAEDHAAVEAEFKKWLSYYDDDGRLKPGARSDPGYAVDMHYVPVCWSDEEAAAFIVAEKKRLGVL